MEQEDSQSLTGFLHRLRPELTGTSEKHKGKDGTWTEMPNKTVNEMPAENKLPIEIPAPTSIAGELPPGHVALAVEMPALTPYPREISSAAD